MLTIIYHVIIYIYILKVICEYQTIQASRNSINWSGLRVCSHILYSQLCWEEEFLWFWFCNWTCCHQPKWTSLNSGQTKNYFLFPVAELESLGWLPNIFQSVCPETYFYNFFNNLNAWRQTSVIKLTWQPCYQHYNLLSAPTLNTMSPSEWFESTDNPTTKTKYVTAWLDHGSSKTLDHNLLWITHS